MNAPHHGQWQECQAVLPAGRHLVLASTFRPPSVPRLPDTALVGQLVLNDSIQVTGDHVAAQVQRQLQNLADHMQKWQFLPPSPQLVFF